MVNIYGYGIMYSVKTWADISEVKPSRLADIIEKHIYSRIKVSTMLRILEFIRLGW